MTTYTQFALHNGLDINDAETFEIMVSHDRQQVWINVDGVLCVRAIGIKTLVLPGEDDETAPGTQSPDPTS